MRLDLHIETRGGVDDLSRVVGVMALLGLTPRAMSVRAAAAGLAVDVRLEGVGRDLELCQSRMRALVSVFTVTSLSAQRSAVRRPAACSTQSL